ncbi:MAG: peptidyl-prolyl cis-trans isomerase [Gemmatimonadaceae bacterium]|nr:peptidyl-prolyl cis-trans isomerase [Gemmatimonadaceae bacterium]
MLQSMRSAARYIWIVIAALFLIGFVFYQQSGLDDKKVTAGTPIATVNGTDINYVDFERAAQNRIRQEQEGSGGKTLTLDQERRIEDDTYNEMVTSVLLQQEYKKRGITISDNEIQQAALASPPQQLLQSPEFQTEGQFDFEKYRRFLTSPVAKQQGVLLQLEGYYRDELPKRKLFEQIAGPVFVTDAQLWRAWQDSHDTAQVSFVAFDPATIPDSSVHVSDGELHAYFDSHKKEMLDRPGRAIVSLVTIPRTVTAADTAAARAKAEALRTEITGGAKFDDVAKRESADSGSAEKGGALALAAKGSYVKQFEDAARALKPGEISQPVASPFGFHIIRLDEKKGDSIAVHHILVRITQSDSSAARTDRRADSLSKVANVDKPAEFDSVARALGLKIGQVTAMESDPLEWNGAYVPGGAAWAFGGAKVGETSELIDADNAYYLVRLDSLREGGKPTFDAAKDDIRREIVRTKKLDMLMPKAQALVTAVHGGQSLEAAAGAAGMKVEKSTPFARTTQVPTIGQTTEAIGAAFGAPVGQAATAAKGQNNVIVLRVDRRISADRAVFEKQKVEQRQQMLQRVRQQRVQQYIAALRDAAKIDDNRRIVKQNARQASS